MTKRRKLGISQAYFSDIYGNLTRILHEIAGLEGQLRTAAYCYLPTAYLAVRAGISYDVAENKYSYGPFVMISPKNASLKDKDLLGQEKQKKRGPQKMPVYPAMCMKAKAWKNWRLESPVMFMKNKQVTRFSGDIYEK